MKKIALSLPLCLMFMAFNTQAQPIFKDKPSTNTEITIKKSGSSRSIPNSAIVYAKNLSLVVLCKDTKFPMKQADQKAAFNKYIIEGGQQEYFIEDVKKMANLNTSQQKYLTKDEIENQCRVHHQTAATLEKFSPEGKARQKALDDAKKQANPLDNPEQFPNKK